MTFRKGIKEHGAGFQMAPMLDIIFILLIHFMAATIFAQWENKMDITIPTAQTATPQQRQYGEVILNIDEEGRVFINSKLVSDDTLLKLLTQISDAFKNQPVILRADRRTNCQQLLHVLDICRQADIWNVSFAAIKPEDEPPQL